MDRLAIIQEENSFNQGWDFLFQEKIKTMDRLAITQEREIIETTFRFSISREDYRLAIIQEQKIVEIMVRFSISRKDWNYG